MCGIAGYINCSNQNFSLDTNLLENMQKSLKHRGPDGYRIWTSEKHEIGLIHRRLSIVDLSDAGFQPMFDTEKTIAVCCNGEIYNHKILRTELEGYGYTFSSHSDTEVIVYAYKKWGIEFINKLEGMFAIIIFDLPKNELYLVRDRIGVKPLYFSLQNGILSFGSEIKALWQLPWNQKKLNERALYHYLTFLATPAPMTLYQNVYKLPPSFYAKLDAQRNLSFTEWYNPMQQATIINPQEYKNEATCIKNIRSIFKDAVEKRLMTDVPFGAFLSGGIDSSLIVAYMAQFTDNVKTFNVSFDDGPEYSEIGWARKVARKFGTDHHEIIISEKEAFNFFEKMVHYQDEPLADCVCIPLYYVSKLLKDAGVTVALVGEGSDELFCGYTTYAQYINFYNRYWKYSQKFVPAFAKKSMYQVMSQFFPERLNHLDIMRNWAYNREFFWSGATSFSEHWKHNFVIEKDLSFDPILDAIYKGFKQNFDSYSIVEYHLSELKKYKPNADFLTSMIYLELKQRLSELLLMRVDKMTMATSVEGRVPFLDRTMVEYALNMPSHYKYKNGTTKYILKKAAEGILPHDVIYRKKMGFAAPTTRWFKQGNYFPTYFKDMLASKRTEWNEFIDIKAIENLYTKNLTNKYEYSLQLWTIQNLLATDIGNSL
ncbi:MAG: asparagine synthase (glutamine-hydrolyzing) [Candidatus Babeliales bacterium]